MKALATLTHEIVQEFGHLISPPAGFDRSQPAAAVHGFTKFFIKFLSLPLFEALNELTSIGANEALGAAPGRNLLAGVDITCCLDNLRHEDI